MFFLDFQTETDRKRERMMGIDIDREKDKYKQRQSDRDRDGPKKNVFFRLSKTIRVTCTMSKNEKRETETEIYTDRKISRERQRHTDINRLTES